MHECQHLRRFAPFRALSAILLFVFFCWFTPRLVEHAGDLSAFDLTIGALSALGILAGCIWLLVVRP